MENVENVMESVEVIKEDEDCEDEVLVLEDTTGGQDRESAEVITYVTEFRLNKVADPDPSDLLGLRANAKK